MAEVARHQAEDRLDAISSDSHTVRSPMSSILSAASRVQQIRKPLTINGIGDTPPVVAATAVKA